MLKLYTDTSFITETNRKIIFPLLFDLCYVFNTNLLKKYVLVNTLEESELVIVPVDIAFFYKNKQTSWLFDFIDEAQKAKKKVWVYSAGDFGLTLKKEVYTFRLGGFHSKLNDKTYILPSFISDPYSQMNATFKTLPKATLPKVGFVGHANGSFLKKNSELILFFNTLLKQVFKQLPIDFHPFFPSVNKRYKMLSLLEKNKRIETDFVYRKAYRAGVKNEEEKRKTTQEFFDNIYNSPYTFCVRGVGNFSVRLYETLAMGRIPILIDTDVRLPLENHIDWEKHSIIANEDNFMDKLIDFHENVSPTAFEMMQIKNRNLWLDTLNRESYFEKIHTVFKEKMTS